MPLQRGIIRAACLLLIALLLAAATGCGGDDGTAEGRVEVSWTSPGRDSEVFGIARLKVTAGADEGISEVRFYCNAIDEAHLIGAGDRPTDSTYTQVWYTTTVQNGEHTLYAVAIDNQDQSAQASRTVTVGNVTRAEAVVEAVTYQKWTPQMDSHDPVLSPAFSARFYDPVPLEAPVTSAGAEDAPFITPDGNNLYFFFTPNMSIPVTEQILDRVTGVYWSQKVGGAWTEPQRVWLSYCDEPSMDGPEATAGNTMWFVSVRAGNSREVDLYTAELVDGRWSNWTNLGEPLNVTYEVGELHVSADGNQLCFHSNRAGGKGGMDIWVTSRVNGQWQTPENLAAVNSEGDEGWPYLSEDGHELWFYRNYSVYLSVKENGQWQAPQQVVSPLAGEPILDRQGNLYFVHHYLDDSTQKLVEADIYVCRPK
jgi:hypothetical protein